MVVPEDDCSKPSGEVEVFTISPQTYESILDQSRIVQNKALSVILSEGEESQYFEESDRESQYGEAEGEETLQTGKNTSKQKKSKRKEKQEKRIKKQ